MSWLSDNLRPASFRGVPFLVNTADKDLGRRVAVHEFPGKSWPYHEDLGRMTRHHTIEAILIGDDALVRLKKLEKALEKPGPGELIHPWYGALNVVMVGAQKVKHQIARGRVAAITIVFEEAEPDAKASPTRLPLTPAEVEAAADEAVQAALNDFAESLGLTGVVDFVQNDLMGAVAEVGAVVRTAAAYVGAALALPDRLLGGALSLVEQAIAIPTALLSKTAGGLSRSLVWSLIAGDGASTIERRLGGRILGLFELFEQLSPNRDAGLSGRGGLLPSIGAFRSTEEARTPVPARDVMSAMLRVGETFNASASQTPASSGGASPVQTAAQRTAEANREALTSLVRAGAAISAARMSSRIDFESRNEAQAAGERVGTALDAAADRVGALGWDGTWRALTTLRAAVTRDLTTAAAPLPAVRTVRLAVVLPSAAVAYALYGDDLGIVFDRAADLTTRNRIAHPGFFPAEQALEALL